LNSKEPAFIVVDKRGKNADVVVVPVVPVESETEPDMSKGKWDDVRYIIALAQTPGGMIINGRAVGLRMDGLTVIADYILPPLWPKDLDWPKQARKRLDTFLECECSVKGACAVHKMYVQKWMEADTQRLNLQASQPLPKALEVLMKAEQARAKQAEPRIIRPGQR
jgi:hypothetical protein